MKWLGRLSPAYALGLALLWPLAILVVPFIVAQFMKWWLERDGAAVVQVHVLAVGLAPRLALLLTVLGPPSILLLAWRVARNRAS